MHVVMSFMTSSWYMYNTQAYSSYPSYSVYTRARFVNARNQRVFGEIQIQSNPSPTKLIRTC